MKIFLTLIAFLIVFISNVFAQFIKNPSLEMFKDDSSIKQLLANLPEGWIAKTDSTSLYIYRTELAWIPRENLKSLLICETCKASLPLSRVINFNMDKRMCFQVPVYFKMYVSSISSQADAQKIKKNNIAKLKEIEKIKSKYKALEIEQKYNLDALSSSVNGMSKSEIKNRLKYLSELNSIGFVLPPTYLGEKYALHIAYVQGDIDNDKSDPPGINDELKNVRELLSGYCEDVLP